MEFTTKSFIIAAVLLESILFVKYRQLRVGVHKLRGTGRVHDIEALNNWVYFVKFLLFALPTIWLFFLINAFRWILYVFQI